MNALVKIQPIPLPDLRRPTATPSLPAWLVTQSAALATNLQMVGDTFQDVLTLPAELLPTPEQQAAIENHIASLRSSLERTGLNDDGELATSMKQVTKMLLVLGGAKATAESTEAKADAYEASLEDLPSWAVEAVARRWYRGDCGKDKSGQPYDYRFMPDPATLRQLAEREVFKLKGHIIGLEKVLLAKPYVDCSEALKRGEAAMRGFWATWRSGGGLKELTFEKAIEIGQAAAKEEAA